VIMVVAMVSFAGIAIMVLITVALVAWKYWS
jgi:cbb3-type cytochrome oxidase subunit 3